MPEAVVLRAATRGSKLALWQTGHVGRLLAAATGGAVSVEPVVVSTKGDRRLDLQIAEIGGKGVFAREVQTALLDGRADLAVHSGKDLPSVTPPGLVVAATPERGDPRDALVGAPLAGLAVGAVVATGSARRRVQLAALRPDLRFAGLRGNVDTRVARAGEFGAIVLAAAALARLGLHAHIAEVLAPEVMVPQACQGTLAVECRADDAATRALLAGIEHAPTRLTFEAERSFLAALGADCSLPAGAHCTIGGGGRLTLTGVLADSAESSAPLRRSAEGRDPAELGSAVAAELLLAAGAAP
ncbi:MAG: hydroxymethylbilane synthase [Acidimicrobiales bacterium]